MKHDEMAHVIDIMNGQWMTGGSACDDFAI
jgi:hypothetical protein